MSSLLDEMSLKREESDDSPTASSPGSHHSSLSSHSSAYPLPPHSQSALASPTLSNASSLHSSDQPSSPPSSYFSHGDGHRPPSPAASASLPRGSPPAHPSSSSSSGSAFHGPDDSDNGISGFIRKTFNMVSDQSTSDIVAWDDAGDSFIVKREFEFASLVLPKYFRHKNFSSFVRQLNFYVRTAKPCHTTHRRRSRRALQH